MKSHSASIGIFRKTNEDKKHLACPHVPSEVFETTKEVIKEKSSKILRTSEGIYLIEYSATGPFQVRISDEWLPVHITKLLEYTSGGIKNPFTA